MTHAFQESRESEAQKQHDEFTNAVMRKIAQSDISVRSLGLEAARLFSDMDSAASTTDSDNSRSPEGVEEPDIKLRDFAEFTVADTTIGVHDHKIYITKPMETMLGATTMTSYFPGSQIVSLKYQEPTSYSQGHMIFVFDPTVEIRGDSPYGMTIDSRNISDILKIEFGFDKDAVIRSFLNQLAEDIGVPIQGL